MEGKEDEAKTYFGDIEEIEDEIDKRFRKLKNFNKVERPPVDHHYFFSSIKQSQQQGFRGDLSCIAQQSQRQRFLGENLGSFLHKHKTREGNRFGARIRKEWEILEAGLPDTIFVTVYDSRVDLMRACIVGLEGTPYCYGLFFFDIQFPTGYPAKPHNIYYHSHDFDLSPDLHRDGSVSLKLGLVDGSWKNPEESNILQVLLWIQRAILNSKPYIGRSLGFSLRKCQDNSSLKTEKEVFILSCKNVLHTLRYQPRDFEVLVRGHFRKWAHRILLIYKDQMQVHPHNEAMEQLFYKLVEAFEANGAYCQHHYINQMVNKAINKAPENGQDKQQVAPSLVGKLKDLFDSFEI
ncbi:hypothetical protein Tsubulata_013980 [Turnera subulata]|uniref:UBC core domain-containing protein n=1 Tax=Turnera subulata TaxID=218843 RepID=A0A9Q0JB61_9ROSI|nr:hypothetical protein Tsubulata_013980 [Turnera subulata]